MLVWNPVEDYHGIQRLVKMSHVSGFQLATRVANPAPDTMSNERTFIDLFAGCGGLSLGLMSAGWREI